MELLTEPPDLEAWIANVFEIYGQNIICGECPVFRISGEVTSIVPEPSTGVMVLLGVLVLAVRRRRKSLNRMGSVPLSWGGNGCQP